ncbi:hypothetical protein Trydic_g15210 [Trypoxylus dichotomus]
MVLQNWFPLVSFIGHRDNLKADKWKYKISQDWWKTIPGQRQFKKFLIGYRPTFTAVLLSRDRKSVRTIVGLVTGHCMLRKHMVNLVLREGTVEMGPEYPKVETYVEESFTRSSEESKASVVDLIKEESQ